MIEFPRISLPGIWFRGCRGMKRGGEGGDSVNSRIVSIRMRREVADKPSFRLYNFPSTPAFGDCAAIRASPGEDLNFWIRFLSRVAQGFAEYRPRGW